MIEESYILEGIYWEEVKMERRAYSSLGEVKAETMGV